MGASYRSRIPEILREAERNIEQAVEKAGMDVNAGAIVRSRVDTGQMRAGWRWAKTSRFAGHVRNAVEHTVYNEYGTRHMSAQPMARPSADLVRPQFVRAVREAYRRAARQVGSSSATTSTPFTFGR